MKVEVTRVESLWSLAIDAVGCQALPILCFCSVDETRGDMGS